jgi:hypothetical protein
MLVDQGVHRMLVNAPVVHRMSVNVPVLAVPERRGGPAVVAVVVVAAVAAAVAVEVVVTADGLLLESECPDLDKPGDRRRACDCRAAGAACPVLPSISIEGGNLEKYEVWNGATRSLGYKMVAAERRGDYAKTRTMFSRPIGMNQTIQHPLTKTGLNSTRRG